MTYLLCHGFGFTNDYWKNLTPLLNSEYEFFDKDFKIDLRKTYVGIGHSLGFLKLNNSGIKFRALICLQGFLNFCGNDPKRIENLDRMIELCTKNPKNFLKFFYKLCRYNEEIPTNINPSDLINDLRTMKAHYSHCGAPTLVIGSHADKVVESRILKKDFEEFAEIKYVDSIDHNLGYSHPKETIKIIYNFLKL